MMFEPLSQTERAIYWKDSVERSASRDTVEERARGWRKGGDTGLSSVTVWAHMMGLTNFEVDYPLDPADLGRILRLLELIPEWKPRVAELASLSPEWKALVERWDDIVVLMKAEVGFFGEKGNRARRTYRLMRHVLDTARRAA
jgi:hypothetical protein